MSHKGIYKKVNDSYEKNFNYTQLIWRSWTKSLISKHIGDPCFELPNPMFPNHRVVKFYNKEKVLKIEIEIDLENLIKEWNEERKKRDLKRIKEKIKKLNDRRKS
tara:strand:- start:51 stop:365 length:315 start_codon:yes stop_codon:yes gene_type:complete